MQDMPTAKRKGFQNLPSMRFSDEAIDAIDEFSERLGGLSRRATIEVMARAFKLLADSGDIDPNTLCALAVQARRRV